jgi:hypothetical protein
MVVFIIVMTVIAFTCLDYIAYRIDVDYKKPEYSVIIIVAGFWMIFILFWGAELLY